jgi:transcriptional regulator of acetoin/glycerol metabolism
VLGGADVVATTEADVVQVRRERHAFLTGEEVSSLVRPEVVESWRRSSSSGVVPDALDLVVTEDVGVDTELHRAAGPVLDRLGERLDSTRTALILSGAQSDIVARWAGEHTVSAALDAAEALPGVCLDEARAGTNGLGTAMVLDRAVVISGPEHFAERYQEFTCAGVPVHHPLRGDRVGAVTLVCRFRDANRLMLPIVLEAVDQIRQRLLLDATPTERLLLERSRDLQGGPGRALAVAGGDVLLVNAAAAALLGPQGGDQLRAGVARAGQTGRPALVEGPAGAVLVRAEEVSNRGEVIGHVVELTPLARAERAARPTAAADVVPPAHPPRGRGTSRDAPSAGGRGPLARLGGPSRAWRSVIATARRYAGFDLPVLAHGEPGTGKLSLLEAMWAEAAAGGAVGPLAVVDAALVPLDGLEAFLHELCDSLARSDGLVVLRHADLLDPRAAGAVAGLLDQAARDAALCLRRPAVRVAATSGPLDEVAGGSSELAPVLRDRLAVVDIALPPLRDRREDVAAIVADLVEEWGGRHRWLPEALDVLAAAPWPGNARQLRGVVARVLAGRAAGDIGVRDLPAQLVGHHDPALTAMERAEVAAILSGLREAVGNKVEAARRLGISRSTLYRKIAAYRIAGAR